MPFVAVIDIFLDAQLLQRQNTTDTEQDFLLQAVFPVTAIQLVSDGTVELAVHFIVSIKQIERDTSNVHSPHISMHVVVQIRNIHYHLLALLIQYTVDGQLAKVLCLVIGNLLAVHRQCLCKVTVAVQETDCTQVGVAIGSFFQVVTGKYTQTAGIYLKYMAQTILHTEISHGRALAVRLHIHVCAELGVYVIHSAQNNFVICECLEFSITHTFQQKYGVLSHFFPESRVKVSEQFGGFIIPCPPDVMCQFRQFLQFGGNVRFHIHIFPVRSVYITNFNLHCMITN